MRDHSRRIHENAQEEKSGGLNIKWTLKGDATVCEREREKNYWDCSSLVMFLGFISYTHGTLFTIIKQTDSVAEQMFRHYSVTMHTQC